MYLLLELCELFMIEFEFGPLYDSYSSVHLLETWKVKVRLLSPFYRNKIINMSSKSKCIT